MGRGCDCETKTSRPMSMGDDEKCYAEPQATRDTLQSRLGHLIGQKRRELESLEQLAKISVLIDPGTPLEEYLRRMVYST